MPVVAFIFACILGVSSQSAPQDVSARLDKDQVQVFVAGKLFTCYKFAKDQKYPYFWPVNGPASGKSITTETSEPYPHHHSLFFGCDRVNGGNYWQEGNERGQIVSIGPKIIADCGQQVVFTDKCLWQQPEKKPIIMDVRRIVISAASESLRFIDFEITLDPLTDIHILKTNHSLFAARVVPELSVGSGGTLVNAEGKPARKARLASPRRGVTIRARAMASPRASPFCSIRPIAGFRANGSPATTGSSRRPPCSGSKKDNWSCPRAKFSPCAIGWSFTPAMLKRQI